MSANKKQRSYAWDALRPAVFGALIASLVTVILCAAFSLTFVILDRIAQSAILPLALIAAGAGCMLGAFVCARIACRRGLIYGALIGFALFVVIWLAGICFSGVSFGTHSLVKLVLLLCCGCTGGYLGSKRGRSRR